MKNTSLSQRINLSFFLIVLVIMLTGALIYNRAIDNETLISSIESSDIKGVETARDMRLFITDHWIVTNRLLLELSTSNSETLENKVNELRTLEKNILDTYENYAPTITLSEDKLLYKQLKVELTDYFDAHRTVRGFLASVQQVSANQLLEKQQSLWSQSRATLSSMIKLNEQSYLKSMQNLHTNISANIYNAIILIIFSAMVATLCGYYLRRSIIKPIDIILTGMHTMGKGELTYRINTKGSDEFSSIMIGFNDMADSLAELVIQTQSSAVYLSTSITELAATSQQQATVAETAATTAEIGATSKQISATARELLHSVNEATDTASQTSRLAQSSQTSVDSMDNVMQQLSAAADMVSGKLALLSERATGINQVVTTIMKVADQTNLLSLNAAIEAEKAGEYGKGFTVVANEIRRLADQTAIATYDIEQMVREIQSAVAAGVMGIDKFSEEVRRGSTDMAHVSQQLLLIIEQVQELAPHIQRVNDGMQYQSEGAEQINIALSQLSDATSQTVESLEQTTITIDNMSDVASKLRQGVNRFKV
jgi:methyl-accepting chemotaxis protein WspA